VRFHLAAYEVLTDQEKRKVYDWYGEAGLEQFHGEHSDGDGGHAMNIEYVFSK
jgi:DnaJ family protein B protein 11